MLSKRAASFKAVTISSRSPGLLEHLLYQFVFLLAEIECEQPLVVRNMVGVARPCTYTPLLSAAAQGSMIRLRLGEKHDRQRLTYDDRADSGLVEDPSGGYVCD